VTLFRILAEAQLIPPLAGDRDPHDALNAATQRLDALKQYALPYIVPPRAEGDEWQPFLAAVIDGAVTGDPNPALHPLAGMLAAWSSDDPASFNANLAEYQTYLAGHPAPGRATLRFEAFFNHFAPFYQFALLYLIAFLIGCMGWFGWPETFRRTAFWLLVMTFTGHTLAIAGRIYISGYPPITNLYGTAVFIGWACVGIALLLERLYPIGIGNLLGATVGFITLLIAHFLAGDGDTLEMMQAVLDTKFWLATHVVVINLGYAATFLAAGLSAFYVLRGVLTRTLDRDAEAAFGRMIYGVVCFALLLSFIGTVLGGLWADDSWGRFWGWDPKENGALMIVLWNALILHARWGGMVRTRGLAVLGVFGGIVTAWSWFGVNQLGVGLHSYGFTESVSFWLIVFVASQLVIMGLGMMPRRLWRSTPAAAARA
jgi:ABC-type transport system involved in cytochrome c biogenesis permease subunit